MSDPQLNYNAVLEIDLDRTGSSPDFQAVKLGFENLSENNNENVYQTTYIGDKGFGRSEVIGAQKILSLSGKRYMGDAVQDFIFDPEFMNKFGSDRKVDVKQTITDLAGNGWEIANTATIANINVDGGDSGEIADCSFEIHFNGEPTVTIITP